MSDLEKWKPKTEIAIYKPRIQKGEVARRVDQALADLKAERMARLPSGPMPTPAVNGPPPSVRDGNYARYLELLRVCSIRGETYASRYMHIGGGHYNYASSTPITKAHYRLIYAGGIETAGAVPSEDVDDETCPFCQASGPPILCMRCKNECCWGSVVLNYHRCFCGHEGELIRQPRQHPGIRPKNWR